MVNSLLTVPFGTTSFWFLSKNHLFAVKFWEEKMPYFNKVSSCYNTREGSNTFSVNGENNGKVVGQAPQPSLFQQRSLALRQPLICHHYYLHPPPDSQPQRVVGNESGRRRRYVFDPKAALKVAVSYSIVLHRYFRGILTLPIL